MAEKKGIKVVAQNRKAFHDYFVEERYEAGIELKGTEVKSIRAGTLNLKDSYVTVSYTHLDVYKRQDQKSGGNDGDRGIFCAADAHFTKERVTALNDVFRHKNSLAREGETSIYNLEKQQEKNRLFMVFT